MRFGAFWQVPGYEGSSIPRRHWETVEEVILADELGFETAWLAESVFFPARPMSNPLMVAVAAAQHLRGRDAEELENAAQLGDRQRLLAVVAVAVLDSLLVEQGDRLATGASGTGADELDHCRTSMASWRNSMTPRTRRSTSPSSSPRFTEQKAIRRKRSPIETRPVS